MEGLKEKTVTSKDDKETEKLDLMQLGENKEWYRHSGKQFGNFLKKKKKKTKHTLIYGLAITFLNTFILEK